MDEIYTCFGKISWPLRIPLGSHILKHMTRKMMVGKGTNITKKKKKKIINIECGIIYWNWLLEWPKPESFQGLCPRTPFRPQWAPSTCQGIWELEGFLNFQISAHATTCALKFKKKKSTIRSDRSQEISKSMI